MADAFAREREMAVDLVRAALAKGASAAEAYLAEEEELVIEVRDERVEDLKIARERGIGLRVLQGQRLGFAYVTGWSPASFARLAEEAVANAGAASVDPYYTLPPPAVYAQDLDLYDQQMEEVPLAAKIDLALALERAGRDYDPRVRLTESCNYEEHRFRVVLANSQGLVAAYRGSNCGLEAVLVASANGDNETGFHFQYSLKYAALNPEEVGRKAAAKAVQMLGARPITPRRVPVVMDPYVAVNFLGVLAPSFSADAVQKGRSLLADKLEQRVGGRSVNIVDDGLLPGGLASAPFDGEGVPSRRNLLVEQGVLRGFLHNSYTAAKAGTVSTGNAARGSFRSIPTVGTTNFYLAAGDAAPEALLGQVSTGLYLTQVMGMHTANPVSGDFSVGAAGCLIEHGKLTTPVRGITVAGNILDILEAIEACGHDLTFVAGRGAPSILVGRLTISG